MKDLTNYRNILILYGRKICITKARPSKDESEDLGPHPSSYLPGTEVNRDHEGGSSRVRPFHCTSVGLTPTITPNVGNSSA